MDQRRLRQMPAGDALCECEAVAGKMSTFVPAISPVESRRYGKFMSTFVYRLEKVVFSKIKHLTSKNVYFRLLLSTFHVGLGVVSFEINGLTATDA
jgi:hypothetical protein